MGSRDYGRRETKKTKKEAKKLPQVSIEQPSADVEVVRKKKKKEDWEE